MGGVSNCTILVFCLSATWSKNLITLPSLSLARPTLLVMPGSKHSRAGDTISYSKRGIVKTSLADGRQEVRVLDGINKSIRVKLINLSYEPREISSLSVPDLRGCLTLSGVSEKNQPPDKDDLRKMLGDIVGSPEEVARLVAKANEQSDPPPRKTSRTAAGGRSNGADTNINLDGTNTSALREGAERMAAMDPAQLKQQAAAMRAMGPAGMRATNPAMANMSDVQIWQVRQSQRILKTRKQSLNIQTLLRGKNWSLHYQTAGHQPDGAGREQPRHDASGDRANEKHE